MTGTGGEVARAEDPQAGDEGAEPGSRLRQYLKRAEEWAVALRDGAEEHAPPEVLSGLASAARDVAQYLEGMAERARVRQAEEHGERAPKD